jgi:hypothetical protein
MPVIGKVSNAAARRIRTTLLALSLPVLVWRLTDFIEEAIARSPKMSMGTWVITGGDALVTQIVIIAVLACTVFISYGHMRRESTTGPNKT